jgi:transposase
MMGFKERAFAPVVAVSLEELVPQDHFYRHLQKVLDLSFVYDLVRQSYAGAGRPSIDPVVFFKLHLVMVFEDMRSERLLMRQVADRLSVRWYLGYDLDEALPDHWSLTKIRNRYGVEVFRRFFDRIVEQGQQAGLVWGEELYIDSTKVQAKASQASLKPRFFLEAHLSNLFDDPQKVCQESDFVLTQDEEGVGEAPESEERQAPQPLPTPLTQQERETLAQSNQERHDWIEQLGAQNRRMTTRGYQRLADLWVSTPDPDATRMESKTGSDMG